MEDVLVRYLHFISFIILSSALVSEHLLVDKQVDAKAFKKLLVVDAIYGVSAVSTLIAGLLLWFWVGKPAEFYSSNYIFHIKLSIFLLIGLLSIFPTVYFLRNRKQSTASIQVPTYIIIIIRLELCLLITLPLFGVLIARGVGYA